MLSGPERTDLVQIVSRLSEFSAGTANDRAVLLKVAGLERFLPGLDLQGMPRTVAGQLVSLLEDYGPLPDPPSDHALGVFLSTVLTLGDLPQESARKLAGLILNYSLLKDPAYLNRLRSEYQPVQPGSQVPSVGNVDLVGRNDLLRTIKERLFETGVVALRGIPGVGKTALAAKLANDHDVKQRYPEGVMWAEPNPAGDETATLSQLHSWATRLGASAQQAATLTTVAQGAQAIREALGQRSWLLVVDGAWNADISHTFRLGGPRCAHIVTTRFSPVALDFAGPQGTVEVPVLDHADGLRLLKQFVPDAKALGVDAESALAGLVADVNGLPLALVLMGKYLETEGYGGQTERLRRALERLHKGKERIKLTVQQQSLEEIIGLSYQALDPASQRALQAVALFPSKPNSFSIDAAIEVAQAGAERIYQLFDYGLLETGAIGRYTMHQTIVDYAETKRSDAGTEAAYERMIEFFVCWLEDNATDYAKLDMEMRNVLHALQQAAARGKHAQLIRGVNAWYPFLEARGLYALEEVTAGFRQAQSAAEKLGDVPALAVVLLNLGRMMEKRGEYETAETYLQDGLKLARSLDAPATMSALLCTLAVVAYNRANYALADGYAREGLELARATNERDAIDLLRVLGWVARIGRDVDAAVSYGKDGLALAERLGDQERISALRLDLAWLADDQGNYQEGLAQAEKALELAKAMGYQERIGAVLHVRGWLTARRGDHPAAVHDLEAALDVAKQIHHRWYQMAILIDLGDIYLGDKQWDRAEQALRQALDIAKEMQSSDRRGAALYGLARVEAGRGNIIQARRLGQESEQILLASGHYLAAEVDLFLSELPQ